MVGLRRGGEGLAQRGVVWGSEGLAQPHGANLAGAACGGAITASRFLFLFLFIYFTVVVSVSGSTLTYVSLSLS